MGCVNRCEIYFTIDDGSPFLIFRRCKLRPRLRDGTLAPPPAIAVPNCVPGSAAASTLLKIMVDQNTPASTRVRAAECVMSHAMKAIEIEDIEARVTALEEAAPKTGAKR